MAKDPLEPGLRDELITTELEKTLARLDSERLLRSKLELSESIERLARHLLHVGRRLRSPNDSAALNRLTTSVNAAIAALGEDVDGDQVALPPSVLHGIEAAQSGLSAPTLPAPPSIALSTSELLVNGGGQPTLGTILLEELGCAIDVDLICAFVGWTGVRQLIQEIQALIGRGGRMRVVTSTYLGATSGKALDELVAAGAQIKVRYDANTTKLHAKSWLFYRPGGLDTAYIGSSNLSQAALHDGLEWNVRLARSDAAGVFTRMRSTFDSYWEDSRYETYTNEDRTRLDAALALARGRQRDQFDGRARREIAQLRAELARAYERDALVPRDHQQHVLDQLELRRREFGEHRHLIVAATGTGKTVIAALDYARMCGPGEPKPSLLFLAHREQILEQSRRTFRRVLRDPGFGEILGGSAGGGAAGPHIFAMVQTVANRLVDTSPDAYRHIYVDEAHHGTADTWRRTIQHFMGALEVVGLTATPERVDGGDVADLFGGVYTTELRLWEAVDDQLLVPFNYVGIDDETDLRTLVWQRGDYPTSALEATYLVDTDRVRIVSDAIHRWIEDPATMRALGFCVSVPHAQFMHEEMGKRGYRTAVLTGGDEQDHREEVLNQLASGHLQIVFSVDVLGEGVDVPSVDTVLLLRPTQSPVLFAQQLGRGLRLSDGKTHCTVMDFIGQHRREYRFTDRYAALLDPSYGSVLTQAAGGFAHVPAGCAITMEEVARERVLSALRDFTADSSRRGMVRDLRAGGYTRLADFLAGTRRTAAQLYGADSRKMSWTRLRREAGLAPAGPAGPGGVARSEQDLLRRIGFLQHVSDSVRVDAWTGWLSADSPPELDNGSTIDQRLAMQLFHVLGVTPTSYALGFANLWAFPAVRAEIVELLRLEREELDAITLPLAELTGTGLRAHARYTRAEVFAALGVSTLERPKEHREGHYFVEPSKTQLMFVTLNKDARIYAPSIQYKDHSISPRLFHWESPNNWRQDGAAMLRCVGKGEHASAHRLLFVRESRTGAVTSTFRLFGEVDAVGDLDGERPVAVTWQLRQPLPEGLFEATRLLATG